MTCRAEFRARRYIPNRNNNIIITIMMTMRRDVIIVIYMPCIYDFNAGLTTDLLSRNYNTIIYIYIGRRRTRAAGYVYILPVTAAVAVKGSPPLCTR